MSTVLILALMIFVTGGVLSAGVVHRRDPGATLETVHRQLGPVMKASILCLFLLVFSITAQVVDRVCQALPLALQRDVDHFTWGIIVLLFGYLSGFAGYFAFLTRHEKLRQFLVALAFLNIAFLMVDFSLNRAIADTLGEKVSADGMILQSSGSSCAAASVANILRHYGKSVSEADMARLMGTNTFGTSAGEMRYALNEHGIAFETLNERSFELSEVRAPAILFVDHPAVGREGHAVAYFGPRAGGFEVWDPLVGKELWNDEKVKALWHGNGIECLAEKRP